MLDVAGATTSSSIILDSVAIGYGSARLPLAPISLRIDFGERIAIVGYNGVGKSTLLRTLTRDLVPVDGDVAVGRDLLFGNLAQEHEGLPRDQTPRTYLAQLSGVDPFDAGVRLIQYGLTRQQVDKPIGQLNPGARARALLASFSLRKVNTLVLDEPTNHLDAEGIREVIATLKDYEGTVVAVSHSRDFLSAVQFSRVLLLSQNGLSEVESIDDFMATTAETARDVVALGLASR
uniref:ABC transporter domain-containing protein n=1 Tax=Pinguiococcus pyrenoidosus TaxID=172671 RepID=A0A7R9U502_9STRA